MHEGPLPPLKIEQHGDRLRATLTLKARKSDGTLVDVTVRTTDLNLNTGLGEARTLQTRDDERSGRLAQATEYDVGFLRGRGQLLAGEQLMLLEAGELRGQDVLGIGGGPISIWAMRKALEGGARTVEVAGQMPKPSHQTNEQPEKARGLRIREVEAAIIDLLETDGGRDTKAFRDLQAEHHAIVAAHVASRQQLRVDLEAELTDPTVTMAASARRDKTLQLERIRGELDPFSGSRVHCNDGILFDPRVRQLQADVAQVRPRPDGRVEVWYADGEVRVVDRVVTSIGSDPNAPGGLATLLGVLPDDVRFIPIIEDGRPVGLESDPPGITLAGAATTGTLGFNLPAVLAAKIPDRYKQAYIDGIREHAAREGLSANSRNIVPAIANVGDNSALVALSKTRDPAERRRILEAYTAEHAARMALPTTGKGRRDDPVPAFLDTHGDDARALLVRYGQVATPDVVHGWTAALDRWGTTSDGRSRAVTALLDESAGPAAMSRRLERLGEVIGMGEVDLASPRMLADVTEALDIATIGAETREIGGRRYVWLPEEGATGRDGKGLLVEVTDGRYSAIIDTTYASFEDVD